MNTYVITFASTHDALEGEKRLLQAGEDPMIIPTPRSISAHCGLAIKIHYFSKEEAVKNLSNLGVNIENLYLGESKNTFQKVSGSL